MKPQQTTGIRDAVKSQSGKLHFEANQYTCSNETSCWEYSPLFTPLTESKHSNSAGTTTVHQQPSWYGRGRAGAPLAPTALVSALKPHSSIQFYVQTIKSKT